jgi:hypothetical protein
MYTGIAPNSKTPWKETHEKKRKEKENKNEVVL